MMMTSKLSFLPLLHLRLSHGDGSRGSRPVRMTAILAIAFLSLLLFVNFHNTTVDCTEESAYQELGDDGYDSDEAERALAQAFHAVLDMFNPADGKIDGQQLEELLKDPSILDGDRITQMTEQMDERTKSKIVDAMSTPKMQGMISKASDVIAQMVLDSPGDYDHLSIENLSNFLNSNDMLQDLLANVPYITETASETITRVQSIKDDLALREEMRRWLPDQRLAVGKELQNRLNGNDFDNELKRLKLSLIETSPPVRNVTVETIKFIDSVFINNSEAFLNDLANMGLDFIELAAVKASFIRLARPSKDDRTSSYIAALGQLYDTYPAYVGIIVQSIVEYMGKMAIRNDFTNRLSLAHLNKDEARWIAAAMRKTGIEIAIRDIWLDSKTQASRL